MTQVRINPGIDTSFSTHLNNNFNDYLEIVQQNSIDICRLSNKVHLNNEIVPMTKNKLKTDTVNYLYSGSDRTSVGANSTFVIGSSSNVYFSEHITNGFFTALPGIVVNTSDKTNGFGIGTLTYSKCAQSFTVGTAPITVVGFQARPYRVGNVIGGDLVMTIETHSVDKPSGTLAHANATVTVSKAFLQGGLAYLDSFKFPGSFTLSASTTYWLVFSNVGATSNSDYIGVYASNTSVYSGISARYSTNWYSEATIDLYCTILTANPSGGYVYVSLPSITGTCDKSRLVVDADRESGDSITYTLIDASAHTDAALALSTLNSFVTVVSPPTIMRINLTPAASPTTAKPFLRGYSLFLSNTL